MLWTNRCALHCGRPISFRWNCGFYFPSDLPSSKFCSHAHCFPLRQQQQISGKVEKRNKVNFRIDSVESNNRSTEHENYNSNLLLVLIFLLLFLCTMLNVSTIARTLSCFWNSVTCYKSAGISGSSLFFHPHRTTLSSHQHKRTRSICTESQAPYFSSLARSFVHMPPWFSIRTKCIL